MLLLPMAIFLTALILTGRGLYHLYHHIDRFYEGLADRQPVRPTFKFNRLTSLKRRRKASAVTQQVYTPA